VVWLVMRRSLAVFPCLCFLGISTYLGGKAMSGQEVMGGSGQRMTETPKHCVSAIELDLMFEESAGTINCYRCGL
jgi:hypothetical protein